jgi:hypothetical protein
VVSQRKPLGKRIRFEIFKRDDFTCQYCGAHPPEVMLEVDHIDPVSLGGVDEEDNLITACFNCNRGKAAIPLNIAPQSLADKAAQVAEREAQIRGYTDVLDARRERVEAEAWRVIKYWTGKTETKVRIFDAVKQFNEKLGVHEVLDAVDTTMRRGLSGDREFRYFCGVCWNKVRDE